MVKQTPHYLNIGGSKRHQGHSPPPPPNSFNFMQFVGKNWPYNSFSNPPLQLAPPPRGIPGSATAKGEKLIIYRQLQLHGNMGHLFIKQHTSKLYGNFNSKRHSAPNKKNLKDAGHISSRQIAQLFWLRCSATKKTIQMQFL